MMKGKVEVWWRELIEGDRKEGEERRCYIGSSVVNSLELGSEGILQDFSSGDDGCKV